MTKVNKIAQSNLGTGRVATNASADLMHHPKQQLRRFMYFLTANTWLQWGAPHLPPKLPLPIDRSQNSTTHFIHGAMGPTIKTASISDQPFCHNALDGQTDRQTDTNTQTNRWLEEMSDDYRPLSLYKKIKRFCICGASILHLLLV